MPYLTAQELIDRYADIEALAQHAGPRDQVPVSGALLRLTVEGGDRSAYTADQQAAADEAQARIDRMSGIAQSQIDGYLIAGGYTTPLTHVPDALKQDAMAIAVYFLAGPGVTDAIEDNFTNAQKHLKDIQAGRVRLSADAEGDPAETHGAGKAEFENDGKVFGRDDTGFI